MKQVIVSQHAGCEAPGLIAGAVEDAGFEIKTVRGFAGEAVPLEMGAAAGLVIMGGPMGVYETDRFPFLRRELALIESALRNERPVLGVCLGSQLLASVLGAEVKRGKQKEIGWHNVRLTEEAASDPLMQDLKMEFKAWHWHGDAYDLPPGCVRLASSSLTSTQALRYRSAAYGFLFHMEITPGILDGMIQTFAPELTEEGIGGDELMRAADTYLPPLAAMGKRVFKRWAGLL